ncbi:MAG: histidine phosphatase family protein [Chitinophagales bacterium]
MKPETLRIFHLTTLTFITFLLCNSNIVHAQTQKMSGIHYVYLVRHGIYDYDANATDNRVSNGLNTLGHEQAKLIGERLATLPVKFTHFASSEFLRAKQTADDMGKFMNLTPTRDSLLNECMPTSNNTDIMKGAKPSNLAACDSARIRAWKHWFAATPTNDTYDLLVCHSGVITWMMLNAVGADSRNWNNMDIGNASLTIIAIKPDGTASLVMYSDVGHLPVEKQTWSATGGGWVK